METGTILRRIARLAKLEHRDINQQLLAMTELYEKTHGVSGKVKRPAKLTYKNSKKAEAKKERKPRSDIGVPRSEEAKQNIRMGQLRAELRRRATEAVRGSA